jgi:acyl-CoA dehydrogenase
MEELPSGRLSVAVSRSLRRAAINWTVAYTRGRAAFGAVVASFQNTQFELATAVTEVDVLEAYIDQAVLAFNDGEFTPSTRRRRRRGRAGCRTG